MDAHRTAIAAADFLAVQNILGAYQWHVDEGNGEEWAALFLDDGVFDSAYAGLVRGHAQLKAIPPATAAAAMIHLSGSMHMHYGASTDEVWAKYYSLVTTWKPGEGGRFFCLALYTTQLVRADGGWKIKLAKTEVL
jgi:hypothetical protein